MDFKCDELILGKTDADSRALTNPVPHAKRVDSYQALTKQTSNETQLFIDTRHPID